MGVDVDPAGSKCGGNGGAHDRADQVQVQCRREVVRKDLQTVAQCAFTAEEAGIDQFLKFGTQGLKEDDQHKNKDADNEAIIGKLRAEEKSDHGHEQGIAKHHDRGKYRIHQAAPNELISSQEFKTQNGVTD